MLNQSGLEIRVIVMPPAVVLSRTQCLAFVDNRSLYLLRSLSGLIAFSVRAIRNLFLRRKFVWTTSVGKKCSEAAYRQLDSSGRCFFTDRRQKRTSLEVIEFSRRLACKKKATQRIRLELKANRCDSTALRLVKEKPSADS